jgi:hypothetical protein
MPAPRFASTVLAAALVAAGAQFAVPATPAAAAWTRPLTLARPAAAQPAVAGNDAQSQAFAWKVTTHRFVRTPTQSGYAGYIRTRLRQPLGTLAASRVISSTRDIVADPSVAIDDLGNVTAVWAQAGRRIRIMGAHRPRGGRFGAPFEIGRSGAFAGARPQVAVSAIEGSTTVVWNSGARMIVARRRAGRCRPHRARGCFSVPQRYAAGGDQTIAVTPEGTAYVAWAATVREGDAVHSRLRLVTAPAGRRFGHSQAITTSGDASQPSLALATDGSVFLAWRASPPAGGEQNVDAAILAAVRDPAGVVSAAQTISQLPGSAPRIGITAQGEATIVFDQRNPTAVNPDGAEVVAALRPAAGGAFGPPVRLPAAGVAADSASLAVESSGSTTIVYSAAVIGPGGPAEPAAVSQTRPPAAAFGAAAPLPADFAGAFVFAAGARVTAVSGGSGGRTLISDLSP